MTYIYFFDKGAIQSGSFTYELFLCGDGAGNK